MSTEVVWRALRLDVPDGWEAHQASAYVCVVPRGVELARVLRGHEPADAVTVSVLEGSPDALESTVDAVMRRRVRQGKPDVTMVPWREAPAFRCDWTDGVSGHTSWFVAHQNEIYELDLAAPLLRKAPAPDIEAAGRWLIETGINPLRRAI